jgi:hypothetical protein
VLINVHESRNEIIQRYRGDVRITRMSAVSFCRLQDVEAALPREIVNVYVYGVDIQTDG